MTFGNAQRKHVEADWTDSKECEDDFSKSIVRHDALSHGNEWKIIRDRPRESRVVRLREPRPVPQSHDADADSLELRRLADEWKDATLLSSSTQDQYMHPAYQQIIGFGQKALPFLIDELRSSDDYWFWALSMITRTDPVPSDQKGNYRAMKEAWLNWAANKNL